MRKKKGVREIAFQPAGKLNAILNVALRKNELDRGSSGCRRKSEEKREECAKVEGSNIKSNEPSPEIDRRVRSVGGTMRDVTGKMEA